MVASATEILERFLHTGILYHMDFYLSMELNTKNALILCDSSTYQNSPCDSLLVSSHKTRLSVRGNPSEKNQASIINEGSWKTAVLRKRLTGLLPHSCIIQSSDAVFEKITPHHLFSQCMGASGFLSSTANYIFSLLFFQFGLNLILTYGIIFVAFSNDLHKSRSEFVSFVQCFATRLKRKEKRP